MDMKKTRWVRRLDSGVYTIEPESNLSRSALCNLCGIDAACPILQNMNKFAEHADIQVRTCGRYVPLIGFRKPYLGLQASLFNTLRLGTTWASRLTEGKVVAITDAKTGSILRFGKVDRIATGSFDNMIRTHGMMNHLALGGKSLEDVDTLLRKAYHNFMREDPQLTAIYIREVDHQLLDKVSTHFKATISGEEANNVIPIEFKHPE